MEDSIIVALTDEEMRIASWVGVRRTKTCLENQIFDENTTIEPTVRERNHILGAQGEVAFCKHFNIYWSPVTAKLNTLVRDIKVYTTDYIGGRLFIYPTLLHVEEIKRFVYTEKLRTTDNTFKFTGWINSSDVYSAGIKIKSKHNPDGFMYAVDQYKLIKMENLKVMTQ